VQKNITTDGLSSLSSRSHLLKIKYFPEAGIIWIFFCHSSTKAGSFLYRSPSSFPSMPYERKYGKSLNGTD